MIHNYDEFLNKSDICKFYAKYFSIHLYQLQ